jgi:integrase
MANLGPNHLDLLRALGSSFVQLEALNIPMKRATRYHAAKRLVELGYVEHRVGLGHRRTPAGDAVLAAIDAPPACRPWVLPADVRAVLSALSDVHIASIELAVCQPPVRFYEVYPENHVTIVYIGPEHCGKTTLARLALAYCRGDIDEHVLVMGDEEGKSLTLRVDARGKIVTKREVMDWPMVVLDEVNLANPKDRRTLRKTYFHGLSRIPHETGPVRFRVSVLATMNPFKGVSLVERTGYDKPALRRLVVVDLTNHRVPRPFLARLREVAGRLRELAPRRMPKATPPTVELFDRVESVLAKVAAPDRAENLDGMDVKAVALFIRGAVARGLSEEAAFRAQIWNYCTVVSTTGFLRDGWSRILEEEFEGTRAERAPIPVTETALATTPPTALVPHGVSFEKGEQKDFTEFSEWCATRRQSLFTVDGTTLTKFALALQKGGESFEAIEKKLAAIAKAYVMIGLPPPCTGRRAKKVMREIAATIRKAQGKTAQPLLPADLRAIVDSAPDTLRGKRNVALILLGVSAGLTPSELAAVRLEGVRFERDRMIVAIPGPAGAPSTIFVPIIEGPLCTVGAVARWIADSGITSGYIFRRIGEGSLDRDPEGQLRSDGVERIIQRAVERIGKDPFEYDGRSLRAAHIVARRAQFERELADLTSTGGL